MNSAQAQLSHTGRESNRPYTTCFAFCSQVDERRTPSTGIIRRIYAVEKLVQKSQERNFFFGTSVKVRIVMNIAVELFSVTKGRKNTHQIIGGWQTIWSRFESYITSNEESETTHQRRPSRLIRLFGIERRSPYKKKIS